MCVGSMRDAGFFFLLARVASFAGARRPFDVLLGTWVPVDALEPPPNRGGRNGECVVVVVVVGYRPGIVPERGGPADVDGYRPGIVPVRGGPAVVVVVVRAVIGGLIAIVGGPAAAREEGGGGGGRGIFLLLLGGGGGTDPGLETFATPFLI